MKDRPVVLGYYFNFEERAVKANALPRPVLPKGTFDGRRVFFPEIFGYTGNLPLYLESATAAGHINPRVDFDGVLRRVPLIVEYGGEYYEALSLAVVRALLARQTGAAPPPVEPGFPPDDPNLEWLRVGGLQIPVDAEAGALVPYRARGAFRYVSLADVAADRVAREALKGKIAIIGTTAPTLSGHAPDADRGHLSRGGDPRQHDRRHPRRRGQAAAAVRGRRRGGAAADRRHRASPSSFRGCRRCGRRSPRCSASSRSPRSTSWCGRAGWCCRSRPRC